MGNACRRNDGDYMRNGFYEIPYHIPYEIPYQDDFIPEEETSLVDTSTIRLIQEACLQLGKDLNNVERETFVSQVANLTQTIQELTELKDSLNNALVDANYTKEVLEQKEEIQRKQFACQVVELSQTIHELTESADNLNRALTAAKSKNKLLEQEVENRGDHLQSLYIDRDNDKNTYQIVCDELDELERENSELIQENTALKLQMTINEDERKSLTDNLIVSRNEINMLLKKVSNQKNAIRSLQKCREQDEQDWRDKYNEKVINETWAINATLRQELEVMKQVTTDNECSVCYEPVSIFMNFVRVMFYHLSRTQLCVKF